MLLSPALRTNILAVLAFSFLYYWAIRLILATGVKRRLLSALGISFEENQMVYEVCFA